MADKTPTVSERAWREEMKKLEEALAQLPPALLAFSASVRQVNRSVSTYDHPGRRKDD